MSCQPDAPDTSQDHATYLAAAEIGANIAERVRLNLPGGSAKCMGVDRKSWAEIL